MVYFEVIEIHAEFYSGRLSEDTPREGPSRIWQDDAKMDLSRNSVYRCGLYSAGQEWGQGGGGSCVHDNEYLESVNVRISLDNSSDC